MDAWLAKQPAQGLGVHERLVAEHGFCGHYQRVKVYIVKVYVRENRERRVGAADGPVGLHRRFEILPGAQAQGDWATRASSRPRSGRCTPTAAI